MEQPRLTAVAVCLFLSAVESQPLTISVAQNLIHARVGDPELLSVSPSVEVGSGSWRHNGEDVVVWIGTSPHIAPNYEGQVELLFPNTSLLLKSVSFSDSGEYIVTMNTISATATARIDLRVFEPISSAYITSNVSNPVRENDLVCLTCNVLGNCTRRIWSFNGTVVESNERIILSSGNVTLTLIVVNRCNSGEYQCTASSSMSENASEPFFLQIGSIIQSAVETCNSKWTAIVAVLGVIAAVALIAVGVLAFKMWRMAREEMSDGVTEEEGDGLFTVPESYTVATVTGALGTLPTYESVLPSVIGENECKNQDQSDSNYVALQFRNEAVYDQLKRF